MFKGGSHTPGASAAIAGWIALAACLTLAAPAAADTFKPTRFDDPEPGKCKSNNCSLREAFLAAIDHEGHDKVALDGGRYKVELPDDVGFGEDGPWWAYDVTISGKGPKKTTLDGNGLDSVMQLGNGTERNSLEGVKVTGGNSTEGVGGIFATGGRLTVKDVVFTDNHTTASSAGGAVLSPREKLTATGIKSVHNSGAFGGGLYVQAGSAAITKGTIRASTIRDNTASFGGGLYANVNDLTILRTTIAENEATEGGGIDLVSNGNNPGNPRPQTGIFASTISGNTASKGGGILADGNQPALGQLKQIVTVQNSTIAENETTAEGGGIMADNGVSMTLNNATVAYNTADIDNTGGGVGGGVHEHSGSTFSLGDSIVAANSVGGTGAGPQCQGSFTGDADGLVIQTLVSGTCSFGGNYTIVPDALIGPLAKNGGPTKTVKLKSGSPAIGFSGSCPKRDQRGVKRPAEGCDSGSFERKRP
jgi:hypothetical protein